MYIIFRSHLCQKSMSEKLNQNDLSTPRCREIAAARQAQGIPKSNGWLHLSAARKPWNLPCRPLKGTGRKQESALASIIFQGTISSFWVCVHVGIFVWVLWSPFWGLFARMMSKMARNRSPEKSALATPKRLALTTRTEENLKGYSEKTCVMQMCFWRQLLSDLYSKGTSTVCVPITPMRFVGQHMLNTHVNMVSKLVPLGSSQKALWTWNPPPKKINNQIHYPLGNNGWPWM